MKSAIIVMTNRGVKWLGCPLCTLSEMSTHLRLLATLSTSVNRALFCLEYFVCVSGDRPSPPTHIQSLLYVL